jgi:hypothetical protein
MKELRREHKLLKQKAEDPAMKLEEKTVEQINIQTKRMQTLERRLVDQDENNQKLIDEMFGKKVYYGMPV